jgi:DNA-binding GntR family transcriptional regulator
VPLSKCRFCGKKVPNPYRPYHERVCVVRRQREGSYVSPKSRRQEEKTRLERLEQEKIEEEKGPQTGLERFIEVLKE